MALSKPRITAVLAVYNGAQTLSCCLETLLKQSLKIEIIVVDDGSTDATHQIVSKYKNVKLLVQNHSGPASARNLGVKNSSGEIILFVDADMTFDPDYVSDLIRPIKSGKCIGTYTAGERVANWDNVWARCWNWQEGWAPGFRFPAKSPLEGTDYRAILKSEFERVGGFDNIGYTDTWTLFRKLGVKPLRTMACCYHKNPATLSAVYRQARWAAKRPYKYGLFGNFYALMRTSLPLSIINGIYKMVRYREPTFLVFKMVYDWGRFVGIINMFLTGNRAK